jgi:hypothetical protein
LEVTLNSFHHEKGKGKSGRRSHPIPSKAAQTSPPPLFLSCTCPGFVYRRRCKHTDRIRRLMAKGETFRFPFEMQSERNPHIRYEVDRQ